MSKKRIYISASTQSENIGVLNFGTEQDRMFQLTDRIENLLKKTGYFEVFRNRKNWTLQQTVTDCNNLAIDLFVDNHTNAGTVEQKAGDGGAEGTEVFYHAQSGISGESARFAILLHKHISQLSLGADRGVKPDKSLYSGGLYVIQNTLPPAALIEHVFHTNAEEAEDFVLNMNEFAIAEAKAICEYYELKWNLENDLKVTVRYVCPEWKIQAVDWAMKNNIISKEHDPLETVDFGTLCEIIRKSKRKI